FPFAIVAIGRCGQAFAAARIWPKVVVLGLLLWSAISYLSLHPHSLAYFNELAGGPEHGHDHLLAGSVDWGQDLLRLKRWMDEHPEARPLKLAYCNRIDPRIVGIEFDLPPLGVREGNTVTKETAPHLGPHPGYFAVSASFVRGHQQTCPNGE